MSVSNHRCEGAAWLSSARAVRCRLKCHNERNPYQEFDHLARRFGIVPMRYGEWEISKTRSFSHPVLRIVELAGLLARKEFLFSNLINCTDVTEIQRILSAEASEYWATHSLPSVCSSRCVKRFGQMILDVLICF